MTIIKAFGREIEKVEVEDLGVTNKKNSVLIIPRSNQLEISQNYSQSKRFQMIQPPGAGKSICVAYVMAKRLKEDPNLKLVIAVPQTFVAKSFGKMLLQCQLPSS